MKLTSVDLNYAGQLHWSCQMSVELKRLKGHLTESTKILYNLQRIYANSLGFIWLGPGISVTRNSACGPHSLENDILQPESDTRL